MNSYYKPKKKKCSICEIEYQPTSNTQKTCSDKCRKIIQNKSKKKWADLNKNKIIEYRNREDVKKQKSIWDRKTYYCYSISLGLDICPLCNKQGYKSINIKENKKTRKKWHTLGFFHPKHDNIKGNIQNCYIGKCNENGELD